MNKTTIHDIARALTISCFMWLLSRYPRFSFLLAIDDWLVVLAGGLFVLNSLLVSYLGCEVSGKIARTENGAEIFAETNHQLNTAARETWFCMVVAIFVIVLREESGDAQGVLNVLRVLGHASLVYLIHLIIDSVKALRVINK